MQIVIEMPEGTFEIVKRYYEQNQECYALCAYVANGTPLPKGHGRLKDVDRFETHDEYDGQGFTKSVYKDDIDNLPTIIDADNESEVNYGKWIPVTENLPSDLGYDWVLAQIQEDNGYLWIPKVMEYSKAKDDWYSDTSNLGWVKVIMVLSK